MKKILLIGTVAFLMSGMVSAANANVFFGMRAGTEKFKVDNTSQSLEEGRTDFLVGAFVGYHYSFFRLEAEYMYHPERSFQGGNTKIETQTAMGNLYFSPPVRSVFHPYVMTGFGVAFHNTDVGNTSDKNTAFAWQMGAGLEIEFSEKVFLEGGARFSKYGDAELGTQKYETKGLSYFGGLRFEY